MPGRKPILFVILSTVFALAACSAQPSQVQPASVPTQITDRTSVPSVATLPLTEADVPRVPVEEAKAALDSGTAVIVDVRSEAAYEVSHVAGAVHTSLDEIGTDPTGLNLPKDQWIITYCT